MKADLNTKFRGLLGLIFHLRHAIDLHRVVGLNKRGIVAKKISRLFWWYVHAMSLQTIVLTVCSLFEREDSRYGRNSFFGVINAIPAREYRKEQASSVEEMAKRYGVHVPLKDVRSHLSMTLTVFELSHQDDLARLKKFRDKVYAHSEPTKISKYLPSHEMFEEVFDFADEFQCVVSGLFPIDLVKAEFRQEVGWGARNIMKHLGIKDPRFDIDATNLKKQRPRK